MKEADKGGALRSIFGLGGWQQLQVTEMIEEKVEKSENRVIDAIASLKADLRSEIGAVKSDLKSEIGAVKADLRSEISAVKSDVSAVNGRVDSLKTLMITTLATVGGVQTGLLIWIVTRLVASP